VTTLLAKVWVAVTKVLAKSTMVTGGRPPVGPVVMGGVIGPVVVIGGVLGPGPVVMPGPVVPGGSWVVVPWVIPTAARGLVAAVWKWWYQTGVCQTA
jgi:hypothetical protein